MLKSGQVAPGSHHQRWHSVRETFNQACAIHLKTSGEIIGEHDQISTLMSFLIFFMKQRHKIKRKKNKRGRSALPGKKQAKKRRQT